MKGRMSRRDARRHAFHLIFQLPFYQKVTEEVMAEAKANYYDFLSDRDVEKLFAQELERPRGRDAYYIERTVWRVFERQGELDQIIEKFLREWTIDRINKVDLALMRLAVYEMLCEEDVPLGVAINEAVELSKEYGSDESPAFINGVLGNISRQLELRQASRAGSET
jgi:N utilization substance protein B